LLVYLIVKDGQIIPGTDLASLQEFTGIGEYTTVTEEEYYAVNGLVRLIDAKIILGKTEAERRIEMEDEVRARRDKIFLDTVDRVNGLRWEAMAEAEKEAWRAYRQALLDIPEQEGYPFSVAWPEKPE
jgi:hypothetical protein